MNKYIFWILTLVLALVLVFLVGYIGTAYLFSDKYVPNEMYEEVNGDEFITLDEFKAIIEKGETIENVEFADIPFELQMVQAKSFITRIVVMVISLFLTIAVGFIIKGKRIEFDVLMLDSSNKKINGVRIALYVIIIMVAFMSSQTYPILYLLGWAQILILILSLLVLTVWILNILYALAERRALKGNKIKRSKI